MIVDDIISNIKLKAGFSDDNYFTDAELLSIINDEVKLVILPLLMKMHEDYLVQHKDYTITDGGTYRLPARAVGAKVRDVKIYDSSDESYTDLNRLFEEDRSSDRSGYYISRNSIELSPDINSGTLRVTYFMAPPKLILEASGAKVQSIDSATQVTVEALPSTILTTTPVDIVQATGVNDLLAMDQTITNIASTTLTFASLPSDLAVGDYICLAKQSPVPMFPEELHPVLTQAALVTCLSSKKDRQHESEHKKLEKMLESALEMIDTRSESNDIKMAGQGFLTYIRRR